ncbi:VWA domain-containing protein, partial [Oceanisphaera ostreae]
NFEATDVTGATVTAEIADTLDTVTATLSTDTSSVAEGGEVTYTVTLTNQDGLPINDHGALTFTLTDGTEVTVPANDTTGSVTVTVADGVGQTTIENSLESVNGNVNADGDAHFENLVLGEEELTITVLSYEVRLGTKEDDELNAADNSNSIIIGDVPTSPIVEAGQNYNIAFIVDSSGSMGGQGVADAKNSIRTVINNLKDGAQESDSGSVNIYISDFDSQVQSTVTFNLTAPNLDAQLESFLASMTNGGGTNYETAFKDAANWFQSDIATNNVDAKDVTYFITDGKPTYYESKEVKVLGGINADTQDIGDTRTVWEGGWWDGARVTYTVRADGNGGNEWSVTGGNGQDTTNTVKNQSKAAFELLKEQSTVEAIGLGSNVSNSDLEYYDSDGQVQTGIDPSDLADTILGTTVDVPMGEDSITGGDGNDILFGDSLILGGTDTGISTQGVLQNYVAGQLGKSVSETTNQDIYQYITENHAEFNRSTDLDNDDSITGGAGNDIIYGQGGNDIIDGGAGNDIIYGGTGADYITGGLGDDIIDLGTSELGGIVDLNAAGLIGDGAADTLYWSAEEAESGQNQHDVVKSFELGIDKLDLTDFLTADNSDSIGYLTAEADGDDTVIKVTSSTGAELSITLDGVAYDQDILNQVLVDDLVGKLLDNG